MNHNNNFFFFMLLASTLPAAVSCFSIIPSSHSSKQLARHQHQYKTKSLTTSSNTQLHSSPFNLSTLTTLFTPQNNNKSKIQSLKQQLYQTCQSTYGQCTPTTRSQIESLISQIQPYNPTSSPSTSQLLQKEWNLLWTSEKEINFFLERGISTQITQTLTNSEKLTNSIPFVKGGGFGVTGSITPDVNNELRTQFEFTSAQLDIGSWGKYDFPPVGKGWFDTVYLDEELRIDLNSRNDILICRCE